MRVCLILILAAALAAGCGPRTVGISSDADLAAMNEEIRDRRVTLFLASNTRTLCEQAVVLRDTCTCLRPGADRPEVLPTRHVVAVKLGRPGRGAGWGVLIGGGAGGLMGVMGYLTDPDDLGASIGLVVAPILYGLVGLIVGPLTTYDFYEMHLDKGERAQSDSGGSTRGSLPLEFTGSLSTTPPN
jgi:hypothetical protein